MQIKLDFKSRHTYDFSTSKVYLQMHLFVSAVYLSSNFECATLAHCIFSHTSDTSFHLTHLEKERNNKGDKRIFIINYFLLFLCADF